MFGTLVLYLCGLLISETYCRSIANVLIFISVKFLIYEPTLSMMKKKSRNLSIGLYLGTKVRGEKCSSNLMDVK